MKTYLIALFILLNAFYKNTINAQCGITINTFPYNENFELNNGNWNSGGVNNDWAWGIPNKSIIQNAGSGLRCWVTGTLNGSFYSYNERSYIVSPCFDFTNLAFPYIEFKIYWEGENQYDGTVLQYTLNNGNTWNNVGTNTDPIDCLNENWFNQSNISALNTLANPRHGWAGTVLPTNGSCFGGNGSNGWVTAKHCMSYLAGQSNVQFRFAFGAGSICNDYDGVAIDDITISNAPSNNANFNYNCTATPLQYQFNNASALCPTTFSWDFGDPASGANNFSNLSNPTHLFTQAGTYNVTLTVSGPCNASSTISYTISTIQISNIVTSPSCGNNNNGSAIITATNMVGTPLYQINPGAFSNNTGFFNNLSAGTYTVIVSDAVNCSISQTFTVTSSPAVNWVSVAPNNITCFGGNSGSINALANGGIGNFNYILLPNNINNINGAFNSLTVGSYTVIAVDGAGCSISSICILSQPAPIVFQSISKVDLSCYNDNSGAINVNYSGGIGFLTYTIYPTGVNNNNGQFSNMNAGIYTIEVKDATNCTASTTITLTQPPQIILNITQIKQPGCNPNNDGEIEVLGSGGIGNLTYSINNGPFSNNKLFTGLIPNTYTIVVKDATGCTISTTQQLVNLNAPQWNTINITPLLCYGETNAIIQVSASGNNPILYYEILPKNIIDNNGTFTGLSSGIYTVIVSDIKNCSNNTTIQILNPEKIQFSEPEINVQGCGGKTNATIIANVNGGNPPYNYFLLPENIQSNTGSFYNLNRTGTYTLQVIDANNCEAKIKYTIVDKICCEELYIPNAFSPNGDFKNDEFKIINTAGIDLKEFIIYSRWGDIAFKSQNIYDSWDGNIKGTEAEVGTYFYMIKYTCLSTGKDYIIKGDVTLVR